MSFYLYYQILRLQASNRNLINMYIEILNDSTIEDTDFQRPLLRDRMISRQLIEQELVQCQNQEILGKMKNIVKRIFSSTLPYTVELIYLKKVNGPHILEKCQTFEIENITKYYTILYNTKLSRTITDLLLRQKEQVENFN
ncbi:hypothetical protein LZ575_21380 [Antarcticibacterium sp. 1MA-6-2]|uniref:hypothetical protein n=1 Tax=Antarcticibacterium sp. 1MA-6-2 TaxID=2908210 RepID=UPI001F3B5A64|nr:hypothetical protein [Antarcticibacterium sp. 1MA-6-2]UJH91147.1 hypothetical protein LZ575_21380 [Antarcticibacterium sp. 1MA-6-2]